MPSDTVNVPVDRSVATEAGRLLEEMGVSLADGVRALLAEFVQERRLPFRPNAETIAAMEAGRRGEVKSFDSIEAFWADLNVDDEEH